MATTTYYGWTLGIDHGELGTWGVTENARFVAIDASLHAEAVARIAGDAAASGSTDLGTRYYPGTAAISNLAAGGRDYPDAIGVWTHEDTAILCNTTDSGDHYANLFLPHLRVGQRITGFSVCGWGYNFVNGGNVPDALGNGILKYATKFGVVTTVSTGATFNAFNLAAETATTGLTHDVLANMTYYIQLTLTNNLSPVSVDSITFQSASVTTIATP